MAKCYVVMEIHYSYDDQIYIDEGDGGDGGAGRPFIVFSSEKSAEIKLKELTEEFWQTANIFDYCHELAEVIDGEILEPFILAGKIEKPGAWSRTPHGQVWKALTADERKLLLENCNIAPYCIQEVEIVNG